MRNLLLIFIITTFSSCGLINNKKTITPEEFCKQITQVDIQNFSQFDYNERMKWTKRNPLDSSLTQWHYYQSDDLIYVNYGFNTLNEIFNLHFNIPDSVTVVIKQMDNDSSKLIFQIGEKDSKVGYEIERLSTKNIVINPLKHLKLIEQKRDKLGIIGIKNSSVNNTIQFNISDQDVLIYLPEDLKIKYIIPTDSANIDTMSQKSIDYIKKNYKEIYKFWYYKYDEKGLEYQ